MSERAQWLVATLGLVAHPEGGFYGEVFRSPTVVHPEDGRGARSALTTIYYLLPAGAISRWHRVRSDEVWHFYEGAPLDLWTASPGLESVTRYRMGRPENTQRPALTVEAGWWQAARSTGNYTLSGCTVAPGFDFRDFTLASDDPRVASALRELDTRYSELV